MSKKQDSDAAKPVVRAADLKDDSRSAKAGRSERTGTENRAAGKAVRREQSAQDSRSGSVLDGINSRLGAFREYLVLSRAELRKVSWPTWKETRATSLVVLGFVAVMAILLGLVDLLWSSVLRFILS
jgi:preprotein translocase subunit SecE